MKRLLGGVIAGGAATGTMSLAMWAASKSGLMYRPPPKEITARAARHAGAEPRTAGHEQFQFSWMAAHLAYGAGCGTVYAFLRSLVPGPPAVRGVLYGLLIYAIGYLGYLPALGLYPPPDEDSPSRTAVMIGAHVVYGATLGEVEARLE
jgi:hypothetical protein